MKRSKSRRLDIVEMLDDMNLPVAYRQNTKDKIIYGKRLL